MCTKQIVGFILFLFVLIFSLQKILFSLSLCLSLSLCFHKVSIYIKGAKVEIKDKAIRVILKTFLHHVML